MTNKITKAEAERVARREGNIQAYTFYGEIPVNELLNTAEEVYQETLSSLKSHIIPDSPWRPIEECPKEEGRKYLIYYTNWNDEYKIDVATYLEKSKYFDVPVLGTKKTIFYMEIPALPDGVA